MRVHSLHATAPSHREIPDEARHFVIHGSSSANTQGVIKETSMMGSTATRMDMPVPAWCRHSALRTGIAFVASVVHASHGYVFNAPQAETPACTECLLATRERKRRNAALNGLRCPHARPGVGSSNSQGRHS